MAQVHKMLQPLSVVDQRRWGLDLELDTVMVLLSAQEI